MCSVSLPIVGNGMTFSWKCEEFLKLEFSGMEVLRVGSLSALRDHEGAPFQLAFIEQEVLYSSEADADRGALIAMLAELPVERVVLAYVDDAVAMDFLAHAQLHEKFSKFAFLPMNLQYDCWIAMLRLVFMGQACVPQGFLASNASAEQPVAGRAIQAPKASQKEDCVVKKLTPREQQILKLVAGGKQNKLIASDLRLSEHTVKLHLHHIITKLGVRNRTEAAGIYLGAVH